MKTTMTIDQIFLGLLESANCTHKQKTKRNKTIFSGFYALSGGPGTTLEEQGKMHGGISREAIRQNVDSIRAQFFLRKEEKAAVTRALSLLQRSAPCELSVVTEALHSEGLLSEAIESPQGILELGAAILKEKLDVRFQNVNGRIFVIKKEQVDPLKRIRAEASKSVRTFGMVSVDGVMARLKGLDPKVDDRFVRGLLEAHEDFIFVTDNWVAGSDLEGSSLARRLQTVFILYSSVDLDALYRACARSMRKIKIDGHKGTPEYRVFATASLEEVNAERLEKGLEPLKRRPSLSEGRMKMAFSSEVFREYLSLFDWLDVAVSGDSATISRTGDIATPDRDGIEIERRIVDAIHRSGRTQIHEHEIRKAANISESEWYTYMMACNRSPALTRVQRGKYKLIGTPAAF